MPITFTCACGKSVQVADEFAGQQGKCPACGDTVHIPKAEVHITERAPRRGSEAITDRPLLPELLLEPLDDFPLLTHAGLPIREDDDFFADAPPEIGRLYTASTTLKGRHHPTPPYMFAIIALAISVVTGVLPIFGMIKAGASPPAIALALMLFIGLGILPVAIAYFWTRFRHTCSYVGTDGIARFRCVDDRDNLDVGDVFLFHDAVELRVAETPQYLHDVYRGTDYRFTWTNEAREVVYELKGRYRDPERLMGPNHPFKYALKAEQAWSMYLLRRVDEKPSGAWIRFSLKGTDHIQLKAGLLVLNFEGRTIELPASRIEKMTIGNGIVTIWEVGAKKTWVSSKAGVHQFLYHDLANAKFFLLAAERLLGIRF